MGPIVTMKIPLVGANVNCWVPEPSEAAVNVQLDIEPLENILIMALT